MYLGGAFAGNSQAPFMSKGIVIVGATRIFATAAHARRQMELQRDPHNNSVQGARKSATRVVRDSLCDALYLGIEEPTGFGKVELPTSVSAF